MSESKQAKKAARVSIPVSKTNFNRVKFQTHTLVDALVREGYKAEDGYLVVGDNRVHLSLVDLTIKPKQESIPARKEVNKANTTPAAA